MKYTIIADSSCDLKSRDLTDENITFITVPISYTIGETEFTDTEDTDIGDLLTLLKSNKSAPRSACPSPECFANEMRQATGNVICVSLSSKLSGSYNSARLAAEMVQSEQPDKKIFVLDSLTTSAGMARILFKLKDLINSGISFEEVVEKIQQIRSQTKIRFLLNDLGNLVKSGRMSKVLGIIASVIPIKLICGDNGEGEIKKFCQTLGMKKGLETLAEQVSSETDLIVIAHCQNEEGAGIMKKLLETKFGMKNIKVLLMRGIATFFANEKGLAISF